MLGKDTNANGQRSYLLEYSILTYYYKNGKVRAFGSYENDKMEGEWTFYRKTVNCGQCSISN